MSHWIRRVDIQLAVGYEEKRLNTKHWKPPYIIQPKLDGDRMRAVFDDLGQVTLLSSEAKEIWAVPHIKEQLEKTGLKDIELDGEAYIHGVPQSVIHGMISSQRVELHEDYNKVEYHIFDLVDETKTQGERTKQLAIGFNQENWFKKAKAVKYVPFSLVYNTSQINFWLSTYRLKGFEGFILRNRSSPYLRSRSAHVMMKFKPGREDIYTIINVIEATDQYGKPKGMIGAFECCSPPNPKTFRASAGELTHEERITLWEMREVLKGRQLRVQYQHLTEKNGVPRHGITVEVL